MADSLNNFSKDIIPSLTGWQHILDPLYIYLLLIISISLTKAAKIRDEIAGTT